MSVDTKYGEAIFKQTQEVAEMFKAAMPKITTNKNGYEIRTKVLEMAKHFTEFEYSSKWMGFEVSAKRDEKTGQVINKVDMPEIPSVEDVLETAEKFYNFIQNPTKK